MSIWRYLANLFRADIPPAASARAQLLAVIRSYPARERMAALCRLVDDGRITLEVAAAHCAEIMD